MKKAAAILLVLCTLASLCACAASAKPLSATFTISELKAFGHINISADSKQFLDLGFRYGDVCDLEFSNGEKLKDIPFFSGYFSKTGERLIVDYQGYDYICIAENNGAPLWYTLGCKEGDTVTITRTAAEKFAKKNELLGVVYSDNRADFPSDEAFANYRPMNVGKLRKNTFFRGASPVENKHKRAEIAEKLIARDGIRYIVDLADSDEKFNSYIGSDNVSRAYAEDLKKKGDCICLGMDANFKGDEYRQKVISGLRGMMKAEGPYYIHCTEGKDRTGFFCILLEALAGATHEQIRDDYMKTYENYFGITPEKDPGRYKAFEDLRFRELICWITGKPETEALSGQTFEEGAKQYLLKGGMTEEEVDALQKLLTEEP